jgi:protein-L-isoaspartate(D-aspartate) O-methyltransferase
MMPEDEFNLARKRMLEQQIIARGIHDPRVLAAMGSVLRHCFVLPEDLPWAYSDNPQPIGHA